MDANSPASELTDVVEAALAAHAINEEPAAAALQIAARARHLDGHADVVACASYTALVRGLDVPAAVGMITRAVRCPVPSRY